MIEAGQQREIVAQMRERIQQRSRFVVASRSLWIESGGMKPEKGTHAHEPLGWRDGGHRAEQICPTGMGRKRLEHRQGDDGAGVAEEVASTVHGRKPS